MDVWNTACLDWEDRLLSGRSPTPDLPLFRDETERGLRSFKRLRMTNMHGRPRMAEIGAPWQFALVEPVFGSYDAAAERRMIQEFFFLIPKKNGKTPIGALIILTALILNRRPEGEFVLVAPTKDIADRSLKIISGAIRCDSALDKVFRIQTHQRKVTHRIIGSMLQVKAADTDVITGGTQVGTLIDELHVLASNSRATDIILELRGALEARPDGFLIFITTQSKERPKGAFKDELAQARAVRDGRLAYPLFPALYELPLRLAKDGGWKNRAYWPLVNPNLGRSVDIGFLERELTSAEHKSAAALSLFASQHFNVEIGTARIDDGWAGADVWPEAVEPALTLASLIARCDVVTGGIDGGGLGDLFGVALIGREKGTRRWLAWTKAWCNFLALVRNKQEAPRLIDFALRGEMVVVDADGPIDPHELSSRLAAAGSAPRAPKREREADGSAPPPPADIAGIVAVFVEVDRAGVLAEIGLDRAGIGAVVDALEAAGIGNHEGQPDRVKAVPQGFLLMGAVNAVGRKLEDGTLVHADQALMDWCVGNAKIEEIRNYILVTKAASAGKIDPLMALFDAAALMSQNPEPPGSVYTAERGLVVFG